MKFINIIWKNQMLKIHFILVNTGFALENINLDWNQNPNPGHKNFLKILTF